jgi:hypothetical protein
MRWSEVLQGVRMMKFRTYRVLSTLGNGGIAGHEQSAVYYAKDALGSAEMATITITSHLIKSANRIIQISNISEATLWVDKTRPCGRMGCSRDVGNSRIGKTPIPSKPATGKPGNADGNDGG